MEILIDDTGFYYLKNSPLIHKKIIHQMNMYYMVIHLVLIHAQVFWIDCMEFPYCRTDCLVCKNAEPLQNSNFYHLNAK